MNTLSTLKPLKSSLALSLACTFCLVATTQAALLGTYNFEPTSDTHGMTGASGDVTWTSWNSQNVTHAAEYTLFYATSGWPTTGYDQTKYVSFTMQSKPGFTLSLTDIVFNGSTMNGGPSAYNVSVLCDGITQTSGNYTPSGGAMRTFNFGDIGPTTKVVEFRFSAMGASDTQGLLGFNNVSINGEVTPVPEPVSVALAGFGFIYLTVGISRRISRGR